MKLKLLASFAIFLIFSSFAIAIEYKSATEDEIRNLFEEIKAKPGIKLTASPYKNVIADTFGRATYRFTDVGHFAHPSVLIDREGSETVAMTARGREQIEKWMQVIAKPKIAIERMKYEVDPRPICEISDLQSTPQEPVKCYEKVAKDNPDSMTAQFFLGTEYIYADDEISARKQFEILLKQDLQQAFFFVGFGITVLKPEWKDYYLERLEQAEKVSEAQDLLDSLGYETGLLVGSVGPNLDAAIREFQRDANLPVNGEVTDSLLESLRTWKK